MPFWPPLLPADEPTSIKHRGQYKYIDFYINLLNLTEPFNSGLKKWMCKAARHSGSMVSLNPRHWRGERLHHLGGGVCWLFVLLWMDSWRQETIVCKKWYKNDPKEGSCGVTFWPTLACTTPLEKMEYPIFYIHLKLYILAKLGYISQLLTRFYFNLSCTEHVIFFWFVLPII